MTETVNAGSITRENREDRLGYTENLADAIRLAREWAVREGLPGEPICIEPMGLTGRQFVRQPDGRIAEAAIP